MRGNDARTARFQQIFHHRAGKRLSFFGVRSSAELVKKHQRIFIRFLHDFRKILHVRRKRGKAFFYTLRVSHVAINFFEYGNVRAPCGNKQPACRHQAEQPHHF